MYGVAAILPGVVRELQQLPARTLNPSDSPADLR